jgi:hypothetical protein
MAVGGGVVTITRLRIVVGVVLAALAVYAPFYYEPATNKVLSQAIYLAIAAMGLNLLTGFNGQVSIGHGAFFGLGAFTSAQLMIERGWGFEPTLFVSALLCAVFGALIGIPALRVRGLRPLPGAHHPRPGRRLPAGRREVHRGTGRHRAPAPSPGRVQLPHRLARERPVAVLPVPVRRGDHVHPGVEHRPQPDGPRHGRLP